MKGAVMKIEFLNKVETKGLFSSERAYLLGREYLRTEIEKLCLEHRREGFEGGVYQYSIGTGSYIPKYYCFEDFEAARAKE